VTRAGWWMVMGTLLWLAAACAPKGAPSQQAVVTAYLEAAQWQDRQALTKLARNEGASQHGLEIAVENTLQKYHGMQTARFAVSYLPQGVTPNTLYARIEGQAFQDHITVERYTDGWFWTPKVNPSGLLPQATSGVE